MSLIAILLLSSPVSAAAAGEDPMPLPVPKWIENCLVMTFTPPATEEGLRKAASEGLQAASNVGGLEGFPWYDGERFYYLNEINTTADRALPESNPPLREEVVPISGIWVRFRDAGIRRIRLEPEGRDLFPIRLDSGLVQAEVSSLSIHSMVVAEK